MKTQVIVCMSDDKTRVFACPDQDSVEFLLLDLRDGLKNIDGVMAADKYIRLQGMVTRGEINNLPKYDQDMHAGLLKLLLTRHVHWLTDKFPRSAWVKSASDDQTNLGYAAWIVKKAASTKQSITVLPEAVKYMEEKY